MVDVEAILSNSDLLEQVNRGRDEHKQLYHQLIAIQAELQTLADSESLDDSINQRRNQIHARFDAAVLKFEAYLKKYNVNRTIRKLQIGDEWRERLELKAEIVHLKTSLGLVNFGTAVRTKSRVVADNSAAIVTKAREATDNSVAKAKEATDSSVAKVRTAIRDEQAKVSVHWDSVLKLSKRGLSSLRGLKSPRRPQERESLRLENTKADSFSNETTVSVGSVDSRLGLSESGEFEHSLSNNSLLSSEGLDQTWDDDEIIAAARIQRDMVVVETFVNRGAFGEVYRGMYNGQPVALKMLLPNTKTESHIAEFMNEVKMQAAMEHPNIVKFMGVAWNSLTEDLCSVAEYMDGGDLKTLLDQFEAHGHPPGFDYTKVKIAMHVARALTYLHLLDPPVIHRDLKSKNILLNQDLDAKLTDFGISRERSDRAMTAGVGTSLWMAPEVMLGQSYDEKADIFSFGVVLAELSTHSSPYANAKRPGSTQQMPLIAILHDITVGKLSVEFSEEGPQSVVELGLACVSKDPEERPTAPEALYRLHTILTHEMSI